MNFLEQLQDNKGGLIRLKTQLCWYDRGGWDRCEGRICLLLDAAGAEVGDAATRVTTYPPLRLRPTRTAAHLLIDGAPHWVWVAEADVEFL